MRFSVIVPVYNAADFIGSCVMSVMNQTFSDWELIIVDDGSTDESGILVDRFAAKDGRIRVFHQENRGQFFARRCGIANSKGDYLVFLDSDDELTHNCLKTINAAACESNADIILYVGRIVRDDLETDRYIGNVGTEKCRIPIDTLKRSLISSNDLNSLWSKAFRRNLFDGDDTDYSAFRGIRYGEDKVQIFYPVTNAASIYYIPDYLYKYNYRAESVAHSFDIKSASARLENEMFSLMYEYMEKWNMTDCACKRTVAVYYLRTFLSAYYGLRKTMVAHGKLKQFRAYNWIEYVNKSAFRYCVSRELSIKEKLELLVAVIGF